jgi:hypothetical protein
MYKKLKEKEVIETFTPAAVSQRALGKSIPGRVQAAAETVFGRKERDETIGSIWQTKDCKIF